MFNTTSKVWSEKDTVAAQTLLGNGGVLSLIKMPEDQFIDTCIEVIDQIQLGSLEEEALTMSVISGNRVRIFLHLMLLVTKQAEILKECAESHLCEEDALLMGIYNNIVDTSAMAAQASDDDGVNGDTPNKRMEEGTEVWTLGGQTNCPILSHMDYQDRQSNYAAGEESDIDYWLIHEGELELPTLFKRILDESRPGVVY